MYCAFIGIAALLGFGTGFLKIELMKSSSFGFFVVPLLILIRPALIEEVVFRGLLLPHPAEEVSRSRRWSACAISLALFVLMHPVNGMLIRHEAYLAFTNPIFLFLATLLGLTCTFAYQISGSLWPGILMHWGTVAVWTVFMGGKRVLTGS